MNEEQFELLRENIRRAKVRREQRLFPAGGAGSVAVVEPDSFHATLAPAPVQERAPGRILVRVTSVRTRLLDEDNLCEKFHVDLCRHAGIIRDDAPDQTRIEVAQRKAEKGEPETVIIEVWK